MYIRVAVPVPGLDLLTYRVPDDTSPPPVGARVVVPLGSRSVTGIVVEEAASAAGMREEDVKPIRQLLDREPFLFRQIDIIKPKVIVALGKFGAQTLLRTLDPISRLRGRVFDYRGAKLIPTFHPAYLLRNPSSKKEVWEDMKLVRTLLKSQV